MQNQPYYIYLVFSKTSTMLARTLKFISKTKYVHSSIGFEDSFTEMFSFGRKHVNNPFSGGFVKENLYDGVYKKSKTNECKIYKVQVTEAQYLGIQKDIDFFYTNREHYRYNFLGLFGLLINKPLHRKYHYFCSQFVYTLLKKNNILDIDKHPELVQIIDLFEIENKSLIYEGFIVDMKKKEPNTAHKFTVEKP